MKIRFFEINAVDKYFVNKGPSSQGYDFPRGHVGMWKLVHKESWVPKNWCIWTVVLEKTLESPLDCKEMKLVYPERNQSWIFIGRTNVEAETPILRPLDAKNWLIWKDPDAGKDWRREEKGTTEDEMVGRHHRLDGHEFEEAPGVGIGQGSLASMLQSMGCRKDLDATERLNWLTVSLNLIPSPLLNAGLGFLMQGFFFDRQPRICWKKGCLPPPFPIILTETEDK